MRPEGSLEVMWRLGRALCEVTGLSGCSLQPAAGAQGELTGLLGVGEDITYEERDQLEFQREGGVFDLAGSFTLDEFSRRLDALPLFVSPPTRDSMKFILNMWERCRRKLSRNQR